NLIFNSMTGYQWMKDNLCLDQDFTPASIFTLNQLQNLNALTQEFVLKSKDKQAWKWVNGLFGSFKNLRTNSPVCFKKDGVSLLEASINGNIPSTYNMTFDLTDDELKMPSRFTENDYSAALYHQSTYQIPSVDGLSVSAGLRLDYERVSLDYASSALMNTAYTMTRGMMSIGDNLAVHSLLNGNLASDFWHLIPKFSIEYAFNKQNKLYASVTRGFQAGGYNIQLFSDLLQKQLQADMSVQLKNSIAQQLQPYVNMGMPQSAINTIVSHIPTSAGVENVGKAIAYNPEYSWNYELGFHSEPVNGKLQMDGAVFYIDTKDRQIAQFSPDGYGRMMKNAAGSVSKGVELSVLAKPFSHLGLNASYGLTEATFTEYKDSVKTSTGYQEVDYSGNYVPMVPKHTLSAGADYSFDMKGKVLDKIQLAAQYHAAGPIYWTEANNMKQAFYGLTDAQISFFKQHVRLDCWIRNAFDTRYNTFYFESMGSAFAQQGRPMQIGFTTKWTF
ncbi:MAG: TonB-dependent receptor, partial [Bacteroidota bacterium]|nr:TonB-dependent receptor [Bacteroidota bacterium]